MPIKGLWCNGQKLTLVLKKIVSPAIRRITPDTRFFGADIGRKNIVVMTEIVPEDSKSNQDPDPKQVADPKQAADPKQTTDPTESKPHEKSKFKKRKRKPKPQFWTFNSEEIRRAKKGTPKDQQPRKLQKLYSRKAKDFLKTFKIESGKICIVFGEYLFFFFFVVLFHFLLLLLLFSQNH